MLGWMKSKNPEPPKPPVGAPVAPQRPVASSRGAESPPAAHAQAQASARSLPAILLEQGKASREQLERALAIQKETGAFLGEILVEEGILDEKSLLSFLAKYCKIPHLSLLDYLIDAEVAALVPREVCLEHRLIPIDKLGKNLTIAMVNPLNTRALEVVQGLCPDLRIKPILCAHKHFEAVVAKVFGELATSKGSGELSMTSFGIRLSPAEKAALAEERARAAQADESPVDFAEKKMSDSTLHRVRLGSEEIPEGDELPDTQSVFEGVFHNVVVPVKEPEGEEASPEKLMKEVTAAMMDSMRDTYEILARRMDLFRGLEPEMIAKIFARGLTAEYEAGEVIFKKGQEGESLYLILNGNVTIADDGREIATLKQGDMFGEMALISQGKRSADAVALNDVSLLALKMDVINNIMPRDVSVQLLVNIILTLSRRLQEANRG